MNTTTRTFATALTVAVVFGSSLLAQVANPEAGLIGKRYAGADFGYDHFKASSFDKGMSAVAIVNLPLNRALDLGLSYSYTDITGSNFGAIDKSLTASLLTHRQTEYGTGYFAATLGHAWNNAGALGAGVQENGGLWGARAGYEFSVGARTAVNAGIGYIDSFDRGNTRAQVVRFYAEGNHWFSRDVAGVLSVAYRQIKDSPDAMAYTAGLRWAF